jgi:hypothetical protein
MKLNTPMPHRFLDNRLFLLYKAMKKMHGYFTQQPGACCCYSSSAPVNVHLLLTL